MYTKCLQCMFRSTKHLLRHTVFPCIALTFSVGANADGYKVYRKEEIQTHNTIDKRVWVTYQDGVYDITDFIPNHPGGADKIILAAGSSVEPFWRIYR